MKTIVIDPGHGGYDYGAVNGNRYEKNDNLRLSLAVRDRLAAMGQKVIMTRTTDVFIPLLDRSYISNSNNTDMFVSIHRNSSTNPQGNGVENFVYTSPTATELNNARTVLNRIVDVGVQSNRGVSSANFSVLRNTRAPAMLLEMGFISNEIDNIMFDRYFDSYADAIAMGIMTALGQSPETPSSDRIQTIKSIQTTLNQRYGAGLTVDGIYGPNTRRALTAGLQTELNNTYNAGLDVDGVFGPATRAAIRSLRRGASGNIVYILQAALFANGQDLSLDSYFGPKTEEALINYQHSNGLTPDGIAGPATFNALLGVT